MTPTYTLRGLAVLAAATLICHCGSSNAPIAPNTIAISNFQYVPASMSVKPGTTISVTNTDSMQHSVTSESATGAFTPGMVNGVQFDTGAFTSNASFTIPSTATVGTVIPYYCTVHLATMGQGQITIIAP
jgi:plastocyanin